MLKLSLELGALRAGLQLGPRGEYASLVTPSAVAMAAKRLSQLPQVKVINVANSHPVLQILHYSYSTERFISHVIHAVLEGGAPR